MNKTREKVWAKAQMECVEEKRLEAEATAKKIGKVLFEKKETVTTELHVVWYPKGTLTLLPRMSFALAGWTCLETLDGKYGTVVTYSREVREPKGSVEDDLPQEEELQ